MFRYKIMWYLFKFRIISEKKWTKYIMDLTIKIIEQNQETFVRLKDS